MPPFGAYALFHYRMIALRIAGQKMNRDVNHGVLRSCSRIHLAANDFTPDGVTTQAMPWQYPSQEHHYSVAFSVTLHMAHISLEQNKRMALIGAWLEIRLCWLGSSCSSKWKSMFMLIKRWGLHFNPVSMATPSSY
ncbi:hypothetical protein O9993_06280 [Vibrio lentus]|nr:hypothetical protein [Vibrio lentus]